MAYRLPPLSTLRVFEAAARLGGFKAAADELLLTPSAVSRSIQTLEQWLGVALFVRGNRTIALTEAGAAYVTEIRAVLDRLVRATETIPGRGPSGSLSISAAPTFGLKWLIPRLARFKARYPEVTLTLDTTQRHIEFPRDGIDLAIRMGAGDWPGLEAVHLFRETLVPVCAPALAALLRTPEDLARQTLLRVTTTSADWAYWARVRGWTLPAPVRELRFDTLHYALDAAANGLGVAIGRRPVIDEPLADGTLVEVLGPPVAAPISYWLVCAPASLSRPEVRAFRRWIAEEIGTGAGAPLPALADR